MKCFDVVLKVLDATYAEIPGTEAQRDAAIAKALTVMSDRYKNRLLTCGGPDFGDPVTRFAYVFRYVPAHSHWLHELITWSAPVQALFKAPRLRMSCLGGGLGSDLVGALKYMAEAQVAPALFCEIVDGCVQWKRTWSDLAFSLDLKTPVHTDYVIHDVADKKTWDSPCSFEKADLFTINFFASEVTSLRQPAKDYFKFAFDRAKTNAFVLLNDNNDTRFYQWVDAVAKAAGFDQLLAEDGQRKIYDVEERRSAVGKCAEKFKGSSKLTGQLAWRVLRKR